METDLVSDELPEKTVKGTAKQCDLVDVKLEKGSFLVCEFVSWLFCQTVLLFTRHLLSQSLS